MPGRVGLVASTLLLLARSAGASQPRTVRLRFPRLAVPAGQSLEACVLIRVPGRTPFDLASWTITTRTTGAGVGTLHFLVYLYTGEHLADFPKGRGSVQPSRACLDLGPVDLDRRQLIASGTGQSRGALPRGVALPLAPVPSTPGGAADGIGILLDGNWSNGGSRTGVASARVVLHRAPAHSIRRVARQILERGAETALDVPPNLDHVSSTETSTATYNAAHWSPNPSVDACMLMLTGHMHKRGRFFGVDLIGADGQVHNPPGGFPNRFDPERSHLFGSPDYTDPGALRFTPPVLHAGEALHYACWDDNGVTTSVRLGCEESTGVPPGSAGRPAKTCFVAGPVSGDCPASDPAYPGRAFTRACVPAHLVAGPSTEDEVCAPGAAPGSECDVSRLPVVR